MCVWAKIPDPTSGNKQLLHIGKDAGWTNNRFTLLYRTGSAQVVSSISDGTNYLAYNCNAPIVANEWVHLAVVFGNRQLKIYVNGELKTNYPTTFDISFNDITALGVGAASNGSEKYTGYLNDVRIYDHALSPMEVKQISQGLILHYLLNDKGFNNNIEYDCSGYCNNGTKIGTFQYQNDTPKYDTSTYAQGDASTHLEGIILPSEVKTVSLWIKCAKTVNSAIFNDRITGLQIGLLNSLLYVNSLTSTKGFTTTHWKDNEWNHVVVINDNGTRFCYVNGQAETQSGSSNYYIHNTDKFWLWNCSYNNSYPFKGNLSDLRIYCTVLSPEDILLLYHNSTYIDNQGNIYGAMYEEV